MNIKDLARISGYSVGTVSRALNGQPNVSQAARDRILALANQHCFERNPNAQNLKQQTGNSILVIVKGRANELFARVVEEIQFLTAQSGEPLIVDYIDEDENEVHRAVRLCREKKPRGVLFLGGIRQNFGENFERVPVPAVLVTNSAISLGNPRLSSVFTDDTAAARAALTHLIHSGHREIAIIGGDPDSSEISRQRLDGCNQALSGTEARLSRFVISRFSFQDGYNAMAEILRSHGSAVTAVFAMADVMAIGAVRCIHDHGLRVPEDISVVGFDGLLYGQFCIPKLTTVAQSHVELARSAFRVLQDSLGGKAAQHVTVPFALVSGESVEVKRM